MKSISKFLAVSAFALLIAVPAAFAQTPEVSTLPVDEPLDVGGTILQPGVYTIRVVPTQGDRNRVQITSPDLATIYATVLTVPHDLEPNEEVPATRLVFYPAGEGQPRALRTWFPPNSAMEAGHDIVYEESRAKQLARLANAPVVSYKGEIVDNTELHTIAPDPEPVMPEPQVSASQTPMEMPETAGNLPLIALLGLASIATALVVRMARS